MSLQKNDEIILEITDVTAEGSGVGRYEGMAVFVPLTAVGDKAKVLILKVKKSYAYGKLLELLEASPYRIENDCPVFARCGGCVSRHISYVKECELKENHVKNCINRIGKIDLLPQKIIPALKSECYRNKAQYPVSQSGKFGFFATHSHRVIECNNCSLQPTEFSAICEIVERWIAKYNISLYNEETHSGVLRHLYLRKGEKTNEIMVVFVVNGEKLSHCEEIVAELLKAFPEEIKSIQLNVNREDTNVILGEKCVVLFGEDHITDIICDVKVRISPLSFYQVNRDMAEILYKKAAQYGRVEGKKIIDLYCGTGTIGLSMASLAKKVIGVEIIGAAVEDAKINALANGFKNTEFICGDAADAAKELVRRGEKADVVFLDPPRKGCEKQLLQTVANDFSPERVVYISCDPATLARDAAELQGLGYILKEYTPVDLFPRTAHVETVALFERIS
ncbi:MAG: 23S rRNA (uracil(1939)-C(5))-methyltransferase RlmD [Ruminococcaceae bacterium]|nr:23S rRNA (uracil(1939)-C(5))-methyltransferase RlmD [Oscillospiraceae bacterium]